MTSRELLHWPLRRIVWKLPPLVLGLFGLVFVLVGGGCGPAEEAPVMVSPTPEPTPEPPPPPEPGRLHYLVLAEQIGAPPGPSLSPLHRNLSATPAARPSPEFLRDDGAPEEVAGMLADWLNGRIASAEELLLVQWSMAWGTEGSAGTERRWGACSLPCTLLDGFVAGPERHPVDPIADGLALFAGRIGARDLRAELVNGKLAVAAGAEPLLRADGGSRSIKKRSKWQITMAAPDGALSTATSFEVNRELRVLSASTEQLPIQELVPASPAEARLYPDLAGTAPELPPRVRGVEGLAQEWPWEGAGRFEGQFGIRPLPSEEGLQVERAEQLVRWVPTARQAGEGRADFSLYSASRGAVSAVFKPFPRGTDVLAATVGSLEGSPYGVRVAAPSGDAMSSRAWEVISAFARYQKRVPLPVGLPDELLVYLSAEPLGVVNGGAGQAAFSLVVDERRGEEASLVRAWARLSLGANVSARGPVAADWSRWVEAQLLGGADRSLWAAAFAFAGDDVIQVWRERLQSPDQAGAPDPEAFVAWAGSRVSELRAELPKRLAERSFLLAPAEVALPSPLEAGSEHVFAAGGFPFTAALAFQLPESGLAAEEQLKLSLMAGDGASFEWAWQWLPGSRWRAAASSPEERQAVLDGWTSFQRPGAELAELPRPEAAMEEPVLAVYGRGTVGWQARVSLRIVAPLIEGEAAREVPVSETP